MPHDKARQLASGEEPSRSRPPKRALSALLAISVAASSLGATALNPAADAAQEAAETSALAETEWRSLENVGLTAAHTLFLREHNRIVGTLPDDLDEETKFQIARRVVGALQQYITYSEFLPAMGVELDDYAGYDPTVDPTITNEFATVGYRAHSQIHGEFEAEIPLAEIDDAGIAALEAQGVSVDIDEAGGVVEVAIPLTVAFGNPSLLQDVGLGNRLAGLTSEAAYANDGQIDNQLRSVLFQIPGPDTENPLDCLDGSTIAECYSGVNDLGAIDVARSYDHGMPSYNEMRVAYGLDPVLSFSELTGESTENLNGYSIDDPAILDVVLLQDGDGNVLEAGTDADDGETIVAERRTTVAARLAAIFGDVDSIDAFTGMVSEPHVAGAEFGELQLAMWQTQFQALRDGDRFFFGNDPVLKEIVDTYGIDYRRTLTEVIAANTDIAADELPANAFLLSQVLVDEATATSTDASPDAVAAESAAEPEGDTTASDEGAQTADATPTPGSSADSTDANDTDRDGDETDTQGDESDTQGATGRSDGRTRPTRDDRAIAPDQDRGRSGGRDRQAGAPRNDPRA